MKKEGDVLTLSKRNIKQELVSSKNESKSKLEDEGGAIREDDLYFEDAEPIPLDLL